MIDELGITCRNHRGFVDAVAADDRVGADALLLNTSFAAPALAEVVTRERPDVIVYDEELSSGVDRALGEKPDTRPGQRPVPRGKVMLLASGTTGTPKGAQRSAGDGFADGVAMLDRIM